MHVLAVWDVGLRWGRREAPCSLQERQSCQVRGLEQDSPLVLDALPGAGRETSENPAAVLEGS